MTYPLTRRLYAQDATLIETPATVLGITPDGCLILDQTVFQPAIEDQPGDVGWLRSEHGAALRIVHTRHLATQPGVIVHVPETPGQFAAGCAVIAQIDWVKRLRHMRMHTALHLLCAAVNAPVTGSEISANHGEVDFNLPAGALDEASVMAHLHELIAQDMPVSEHWLSGDELAQQPDVLRYLPATLRNDAGPIRVISAGPHAIPCNGLHVQRTGQIGPVVSQGIRYEGAHHLRVSLAFDDEIDD